jgi:hypothetical protein
MTFICGPTDLDFPGGIITGVNCARAAVGLTLPVTPTVGNMLVAIGFGYSSAPGVNTGAGWTELTAAAHNPSVSDPGIRVAWLPVAFGQSATVQPFTGNPATSPYALAVWEVTGLDAGFTATYETVAISAPTFGATTITLSRTTASANTLCLFAGYKQNATDPGPVTLTGAGWTVDGEDHGVSVIGGQNIGQDIVATRQFMQNAGTAISEQITYGLGGTIGAVLLSLLPVV